MRIVAENESGILEAAAVLRTGGVVAYPAETMYGLGADPFSIEAVTQLFGVKRRPQENPVLLIVADVAQAERLASVVSPAARKCMEQFWPGPLSLLMPKAKEVPDSITAGSDKVCIRCPARVSARQLCAAFGGGITSTSANISGEAPARILQEIDLPGVSMGIDGGQLPLGPPSTIFDPDTRQVLREGAITADNLLAFLDS